MAARRSRANERAQSEQQPFRIRLPGFVTDDEVGLGDVIKRATSAIGAPPCGGCARRAAMLNQFLLFDGRRRR